MHVRIAICDPLPAFRLGILAMIRDAGYEAESTDDLMAWIRDDQQRLVWLTLQTARDWSTLDDLRRRSPDTIVVAMLDDADVNSCVRALRSGAVSAIPRNSSVSAMRDAFLAAVNGRTTLSFAVLRALTELPLIVRGPDTPSDTERDWLSQLSRGVKVNELAAQAGYSERMMFRLLRDLYAKLGTANRIDALMRARDAGWLS